MIRVLEVPKGMAPKGHNKSGGGGGIVLPTNTENNASK
jgi:hypothetical protein